MKKDVCVPLGLRLPTSGDIDEVETDPVMEEHVKKTNTTKKRQIDKQGRTRKQQKAILII